jgi:hypothetical protein
MKIAKIFSAAIAGVLGVEMIIFGSSAARAGTGPDIFVDNFDYVTAYPIGSSGNLAPLALTADLTYPSSIARDGQGRIYLTNSSTNTITIYAADATGNVPPLAVIGGARTRLANPAGIALDGDEKIYVLNTGTSAITIYSPLGIGTGLLNQAPTAMIAGAKTKLAAPIAIAVDTSGNIYVANQLGGPVVKSQGLALGAITEYSAGSDGNLAPSAIISGVTAGLIQPVTIAVDSERNIYVANTYTDVGGTFTYQPNISVYSAGSARDAEPIAIITGANTDLNFVVAIALDSARNIYAAGYTSDGHNIINRYPADSSGNISPAASIVGANTGLNAATAITLDFR